VLTCSIANLGDDFKLVHANILQSFRALDTSAVYTDDPWTSSLGSGRTCVMSSGSLVEKAAVNISIIESDALPHSALADTVDSAYTHFQATGVSVIIHPQHPFIPSAHMNVRLFRLFDENDLVGWWIGGGYDLTPYFVFEEDVRLWHIQAKQALDAYGSLRYPAYKAACDKYFYLPHRDEMRGVGGVFYDKVNDLTLQKAIELSSAIGKAFQLSYAAIFTRRQGIRYNENHIAFMHHRRTRYAEFNLLYDRGTKFGLHSKGRIDSIFASMPPSLGWSYQLADTLKPFEADLTPYLQPKVWV